MTTSPTIATSKFAPFATNKIAVFTVTITVLLVSITVTGGSPGTKIYSANAPATFTTVPPSGKLVIVASYVTIAVSPTGMSTIVNPT